MKLVSSFKFKVWVICIHFKGVPYIEIRRPDKPISLQEVLRLKPDEGKHEHIVLRMLWPKTTIIVYDNLRPGAYEAVFDRNHRNIALCIHYNTFSVETPPAALLYRQSQNKIRDYENYLRQLKKRVVPPHRQKEIQTMYDLYRYMEQCLKVYCITVDPDNFSQQFFNLRLT